jgi:hypothetical protein
MRAFFVLVLTVFLFVSVSAISGVSPASYEVNFTPEYRGEFVFDFVVGGSSSMNLYVEGGLAEYVSLDRKTVSGMQKVVATLDLPTNIEEPGVNYIKIGANNENKDISGFIKVSVPYPNNYVGVNLKAPNANVGEDVLLELELFSLGDVSTDVFVNIEIYKEEELVEVLSVGNVKVFKGQRMFLNSSLSTREYSIGDYSARAIVSYDGREVVANNPFRLGGFLVEVVDHTKSFRENKIENFNIVVENSWNGNMKGVFADVNILGEDSVDFVTSPVDLRVREIGTLSGFLDTSEIGVGEFEAEIVLHYGEETNSELVSFEVLGGLDYILWSVVLVGVLLVVFMSWRVIIFIGRYKKHKIKGRNHVVKK